MVEDQTLSLYGVQSNDSDEDDDSLVVSFESVVYGDLQDFEYSPPRDFNGTDTLTYVLLDPQGAESAPAEVTVVVLPAVDGPLAVDDDVGNVTPGVPATGNVLGNDTDADGDPLTAEVTIPPLGGTVALSSDGAFTYVPHDGFSGSDAFTYVARDPTLLTDPAVVTLFVLPATAPPDTGDTGDACDESDWFLDADGDGYGDDATQVQSCVAPPGHVAEGGDCNDALKSIHPGVDEFPVADGVDQDCDGIDNHVRPIGACATGPPVLSLFVVLLAALATRTARASTVCAEDTPAEVDDVLTSVWEAYVRVDEPAFDRASKSLTAAIACLDRAPTAVQIARLHQGMALVSFVGGQTRAAKRSLAAARLLDPGWKLPLDPFAEGHPYRELWEAATDPGPVEPIGRAPETVWIVDGIERDEAPSERAMLLQVSDGGGIFWSGYVWSFEDIPDRGQGSARGPVDPPYDLGASALLLGVYGTSHQQEAAEPGTSGGASLTVRCTPLALIGVELEGELIGSTPLAAGHAVALVGGAGRGRTGQPHASVRLGAAWQRVVLWDAWTVGSLVVGVEAGMRARAWRAAFTADLLAAGVRDPSEIRLRADLGRLFGDGPVALEGLLQWRSVTLLYEDVDGFPAGTRTDHDFRVGMGIATWL
jgi:hypothetical protein